MPCDPDRADTAAFCETYGYALDDSANTIVVAGKSSPPMYAACVVLATTRLDVNRVVRRRLGVSKASFASADADPRAHRDGHRWRDRVRTARRLADLGGRAVMTRERIVLGGGSRRCKVVASPSILRALAGVEIVEGLATPAEQP